MLNSDLKNCSLQQPYTGSELNLQAAAWFQKDWVPFQLLYSPLYWSQNPSKSPDGCHQPMRYVKRHKTEKQKPR